MIHIPIEVHHFFFQKKELNEIYLSIFLFVFAESLISIFIPIYLFVIGYTIPTIIAFHLLISGAFILFIVPAAKFVTKRGAKHAVLFSLPFLILYYTGLRLLPGQPLLFIVLPFLVALHASLFNMGYHYIFITNSVMKERGRELSVIGILTTLAAVAAPIVAGYIILLLGYGPLFLIASGILLLAVVPLFFTPDARISARVCGADIFNYLKNHVATGTIYSFSSYALESIIARILWPIFVILAVMKTETVGAIASISLLISIIVFYFAGQVTDNTDKGKVMRIGAWLSSLGWILRIFATTTYRIFFVDSYKNIVQKFLLVPWEAKSYDLPEEKNYLLFIASREIIYNCARIVLLPILIFIFYVNYHPYVISFIIAAIATWLYPRLGNER